MNTEPSPPGDELRALMQHAETAGQRAIPFPGTHYLVIACTPGWRSLRIEATQPCGEGPPSHIEVINALLGTIKAVRRSARRRRPSPRDPHAATHPAEVALRDLETSPGAPSGEAQPAGPQGTP